MSSWGLLLALTLASLFSGTSGNGFLQWELTEPLAGYPFDAPLAPAMVARPAAIVGGAELVLSFSSRRDSAWEVVALGAATGLPAWTANLTGAASAGIVTGVQTPQPANSLALAAALMDGRVVALNASTGETLWQAVPPGGAPFLQVSGWNGVAYLLTGQEPGAASVVGGSSSSVVAVDAASGRRLWAANASLLMEAAGGNGLGAYSPVRETLTAAPGLAIFACGNKVVGLSLADGSAAWTLAVSVDAGGSGAAANVTDVQYLAHAGGSGTLLVSSINWGYQRFSAFALGGAAGSEPALLWASRRQDAEQAFPDTLARPALFAADKAAGFVYWANRTAWGTNGSAVQHTLVARGLDDGREAWSKQYNGPVAAPAARGGRVFAVAEAGLLVLDSGSGGAQWGVPGPAAGGQGGLGGATYDPAVAFSDQLGQVVVMRCLGPRASPNALCSYAGYAHPAPVDAAPAPRGSRALLALGAAALVLLAML